jgi:hypothetical protein
MAPGAGPGGEGLVSQSMEIAVPSGFGAPASAAK